MYPLRQSTALDVLFFLHDSSGNPVTGKVDGDFTKRISKAAGAFAAMTVTITEREAGWYLLPLSTAHSDTLGILTVYLTCSGAMQVNNQWRVSFAGADANLIAIESVTPLSAAVFNLKQLNVVNTTGTAIIATSSGSNGHGIQASGDGSGEGITATGGLTGHGIQASGGATSGDGIRTGANGDGSGIRAAGAADGSGLLLVGSGAGHGIFSTAGSTGHGVRAIGGATSGVGIRAEASGNGDGITTVGVGVGTVGLRATLQTDVIGSDQLAASAVTEIQAGLATSAALATVQADTDDIQTRLPAALVGGRMDSSVGAMAANVITAASIATDAIDADALAADAITEIQAGLATAVALAAVQADTDNIQTRLPAALVGGRMDSSVGAMAANVITAAAIATDAIDADALAPDAITEIQAGLATSAALATVQADTDNIQTRLPAALVGGRMDSSVGAYAAGLAPLQPTTPGNTLDVTATGAAAIDWGNVEGQATVVALTNTTIAAVAAVGDVVGDVQGSVLGNVDGSVGSVIGLNPALLDAAVSTRATPAQVNAEVLDVLNVDTFAEPAGVPAATATLVSKIGRLHQALRNEVTVDANTGKKQFHNDAGAIIWEKDFTDALNVYNETEGNAP